MLLVSSIVGVALAAIVALLRGRLPREIAIAIVTVFAVGPLAAVGRTELGQDTGRALWEWSAVGGAVVQAAYHIDPLAVTAATVVAIATGIALVASSRVAGVFVPALLAALALVLIALVATTDVVVAALVAGTAAALAVAAALFVAPVGAAARLAALLAIGVECFIAAALLLARSGVASFDLDDVMPAAVSSGVVLAAVIGGALFAGLYPFVAWRYERAAAASAVARLRGLALFPTGVAASVFAFRVIATSGLRPDQIALPSLSVEMHAAVLAIVLVLAALAIRAAPRAAIPRRAVTAAVFVAAALALPFLSVAHVMALLALLTIVYATVASTAVVEEWSVARFDVRLAVVWAAYASGSAPSLAAALFGLVATAFALVLETIPLPKLPGAAIATSARLLNLVGPFLALAGVAFAPDPLAGALSGLVLAFAALLELGHAVREGGTHARDVGERAFSALVAVAIVFVVSLVASLAATSAAVDLLGPLPAEALDLVLVALALLAVALAVVVVALPGTIRARLGARGVGMLRRVLALTDPVPALALGYRALEAWSERIGAGFATFEDRAGIWLATALIALALLWAATS